MGSKVLPQALITIPGHLNQCPTKKLGFSTVLSRRSSPFLNSSLGSISRVSSSSVGPSFTPVVAAMGKRIFVVKAESNSEGDVESAENAEDSEAVSVEESSEVKASAGAEAEGEAKEEAVSESVETKPPWKPRPKLGDIMGMLNKKAIEASEKERPVPDIRTGDIVEIKLEVPENRRRLSIYKGIVISKQNAGIHTTIRIRRIIAGIGVEIVFPLYSPNIKEIKVVKHRKVRRARLYFLRDKLPRLSTFK
ncbi:large ribosomal subunit protein bL19cy [Ziziphus jujuba]|uniref:Large ribosomal subunit protein bL19cy n=2 Tax=Ziziphus jujuba TaxID=326968 RepID=A0ABM3I4S6_ZIZJJ|nr:large ribosomal subunit protein bL19cy [Ziziphus jujuba]KAH7514248.1 hypothetical protein FEM48_Zijuj11G0068600 [Ziziphus jujuba var. spinosa]